MKQATENVFSSCTVILVSAVLFIPLLRTTSQTHGAITGTIKDEETIDGIPYVNVTVKGAAFGAATDENGQYVISNVPPGIYAIIASAVGYETIERTVKVTGGSSTIQDFLLKPSTVNLGEVVVYGASLRRERVTEAPSAVSVLTAKDISLFAGHGQLPNLLGNEPGVDVVQNGLFDFNINTRGFNSSLNRRLLVLMDGRDMAIVFLGAQEWNGLTIPLDDLGRIEIIRGPGSALYGANAYNGVINIATPPPRSIVGTKVTLAGGSQNSWRSDVRHAGVSGAWSYKVNLGGFGGITWSVPRPDTLPPPVFANGEFEYKELSKLFHTEAKRLDNRNILSTYGSGRIDYDFESGSLLTTEGGVSQVENEVYVTGIGRVQVKRAIKPWSRIAYTAKGFNAQVWYSGRTSRKPQYSLSTGLALYEKSDMLQGEFQYSFTTLENKLTVVAGASHRIISIDTKNPEGNPSQIEDMRNRIGLFYSFPIQPNQSLMREARSDNISGIFSQVEYRLSEVLKGVLAARWDRSTLHESQVSPKAAIVWTPWLGHSFRLTYNQAFQAPNYSELYLFVIHPFRDFAYFGNDKLKVEKITGYELGYKGVFDKSLFVTADFYFNQMSDFITDLAGEVNPQYPLEPVSFPGDFRPKRSILSYGNAGRVNEGGFEIGTNYYLTDDWLLSFNVAYFTFEVLEKHQRDALLPNSPKYRLNGGITYTNPMGLDLSLRMKYVPSYPWAAGIYKDADIKAYHVIDFGGTYRYSQNLQVGATVTNLLDRRHYQIFGGSLLGRRAVATATYSF